MATIRPSKLSIRDLGEEVLSLYRVVRPSKGIRGRQLAANPLCKDVRNLRVTRNRLGVACLRVFPQGMFFALSPQNAAVTAKVP